jgi:hypothetical protein
MIETVVEPACSNGRHGVLACAGGMRALVALQSLVRKQKAALVEERVACALEIEHAHAPAIVADRLGDCSLRVRDRSP